MKVAEDIAQDVFLKVWEKMAGIRPETIKPYLFKLASNRFLNWHDHQVVQLKFLVDYQPGVVNERPDFELEIKEFDILLQAAINGLDDKKKMVFLMNRIEKLTYSQIAGNLGITVKAVEKRMEKALIFLKKQIGINI